MKFEEKPRSELNRTSGYDEGASQALKKKFAQYINPNTIIMFEAVTLGLIQGISEWLPVSSEGLIVLARIHIFGAQSLTDSIRIALFLHLGTFFAALVYFRKDIFLLSSALIKYRTAEIEKKLVLRFIIIATLISGALGALLLFSLSAFEEVISMSGKIATGIIGILLLITAFLGLKKKGSHTKEISDISPADGILTGIAQGFSALPGLSRSGLTVSTLLLRKFDDETALRLSFLLSLPIVLAGNIALNLTHFSLSLELLLGATVAFVVGLVTIYGTLALARKINWSWFLFVFGALMILSAFV